MHLPQHNDESEDGLTPPTTLVEALKGLPVHRPFIAPTVDEATLRAAQRHLHAPERQAHSWWRLVSWATATAVICVLAIVGYQRTRPPLPSNWAGVSVPAQEDLNRDGRVDILDAFALARGLKAGGAAPFKGVDINGDGVVDEKDAVAIAAHAVQLPKGGRS